MDSGCWGGDVGIVWRGSGEEKWRNVKEVAGQVPGGMGNSGSVMPFARGRLSAQYGGITVANQAPIKSRELHSAG